MSKLLPWLLLIGGGCSYSKPLLSLPHADGSGVTHYRAIHVGGVLRPGVVVVVQETVGTNAPCVLTTAHGTPLAPAVFGVAGNVGAALALGSTLRPDESHNSSSTTVIQGKPSEGPMGLPGPPGPPGPSGPPSRPPFGPPPWHGSHPHNKGH